MPKHRVESDDAMTEAVLSDATLTELAPPVAYSAAAEPSDDLTDYIAAAVAADPEFAQELLAATVAGVYDTDDDWEPLSWFDSYFGEFSRWQIVALYGCGLGCFASFICILTVLLAA